MFFLFRAQGKKMKPLGFTLLEMLVSITIIGIVAAITVVNYRSSTSSVALQTEVHKIVADLRRVQVMALGSSEFSGSVPSGGWGLRYVSGSNTYYLFADINNDHLYASNELFTTVTMSTSVTFTTTGTVTYQPPDPITYINGVNAGSAVITVTDGLKSKNITINFLGLIDITEES